MDVLEDMSRGQINLASEAARRTVANTIVAVMKTNKKGWFLDLGAIDGKPRLTKEELEIQRAKETWVCYYCGENTADVDYDYIGTGTNHLGCELENDIKPYINDTVDETDKDKKVDWFDDKRVTGDRRKGNRREKNWSQTKHEDKVFNQAVFGDSKDLTEARIQSDYKNKLSEEIVDNKDEKYIYESPDSGKTVYKRKVGGSERELVKDWKKINVRK